MALVNNGTVSDQLPANAIPAGFSHISVTTFSDYEQQYVGRSMSVLKSVVENATATTTLTNIVAQLTTDVSTLITADFDVTNTVDAYAILRDITTNDSGVTSADFYTDTVTSYVCTVDIFVKTS